MYVQPGPEARTVAGREVGRNIRLLNETHSLKSGSGEVRIKERKRAKTLQLFITFI